MDLSLFTKVDCKRNNYSRNGGEIVFYRKGHRARLSGDLVEQANLKAHDRIDLYKLGNTYALKKDPVGCLKLSTAGGGKCLSICSVSLWLNTAPHAGDAERYEAWVEEGIVFFKKK